MSYTYKYPRPALTVDTVVFGLDVDNNKWLVLLVERGGEPFKGKWAIPGGFVNVGESVDDAALRELEEECGVKKVFIEQLYTFGAPDRDPREHVVSVAYLVLVNIKDQQIIAGSDASRAEWFPVKSLPKLAFDHQKILAMAKKRLQGKIRYDPLGFELLPKKFTLTQLQNLYETILDTPLDKRNFRKKVQAQGILRDLGEIQKNVTHRAAKLYSFDKRAYRKVVKSGGHFSF
ncbi:MAG: NUDIX domain-containing protein [Verrucomicrobiales bacterium]|nr:NUDIX domain-containing protein [Verrucomicrobiales bacterium]